MAETVPGFDLLLEPGGYLRIKGDDGRIWGTSKKPVKANRMLDLTVASSSEGTFIRVRKAGKRKPIKWLNGERSVVIPR